MLRLFRNKKAQNTAEYAIMIAIIIGAFSVMQVYIKRGLQAKIKEGTDNIPDLVATQAGGVATSIFNKTELSYEPVTEAHMKTTSSEGKETGAVTEKGGIRELSNATSSRTGNQTLY
jgi:hypothetical protein